MNHDKERRKEREECEPLGVWKQECKALRKCGSKLQWLWVKAEARWGHDKKSQQWDKDCTFIYYSSNIPILKSGE